MYVRSPGLENLTLWHRFVQNVHVVATVALWMQHGDTAHADPPNLRVGVKDQRGHSAAEPPRAGTRDAGCPVARDGDHPRAQASAAHYLVLPRPAPSAHVLLAVVTVQLATGQLAPVELSAAWAIPDLPPAQAAAVGVNHVPARIDPQIAVPRDRRGPWQPRFSRSAPFRLDLGYNPHPTRFSAFWHPLSIRGAFCA